MKKRLRRTERLNISMINEENKACDRNSVK